MVTAIFPAAGQGKRMEVGVNKVFLELLGKPILVHTVLAFSKCAAIDDLIVVVAPEEVAVVTTLLRAVPNLKPWQVIAGSTERQYSIANGLAALHENTDIVLVHDGARPLTSDTVITAVVEESRRSGATVTGVPAKNTIKIVDEDQVVMATPERNTLWSVQTPQGFQRNIILNAYKKAEEDHFLGTDDSSLVERLGIKVKVVKGEYSNLKITTPEDFIIAEAFLRKGAVSRLVSGVSTIVSDVKETFKKGVKKL
jgi:2-C-methyl-D-erythritol 4-phosphate cytidylyltransferase